MAAKTWIPKLVHILDLACRYIGRWEQQLHRHIPEESWPLLDAVVTACVALREVLEEL